MWESRGYGCIRRLVTLLQRLTAALPSPFLQKNMDPEVMEEFKERHAKMAGAQSALQSGDLMSGYVGGLICQVSACTDVSMQVLSVVVGGERGEQERRIRRVERTQPVRGDEATGRQEQEAVTITISCAFMCKDINTWYYYTSSRENRKQGIGTERTS